MIDQKLDSQGWFKVIEHDAHLHKHKSHIGNKYYEPPII